MGCGSSKAGDGLEDRETKRACAIPGAANAPIPNDSSDVEGEQR